VECTSTENPCGGVVNPLLLALDRHVTNKTPPVWTVPVAWNDATLLIGHVCGMGWCAPVEYDAVQHATGGLTSWYVACMVNFI
jgi:hypothetical protein